MFKRIIYSFLFIFCACTYVGAQSFCGQVQPVGTSFIDTITQPGTYYYSAQTADLPMDLNFISTDPTCPTPPELWFDLTCNPGVYTDPNIRELIQDTAKYGISVPMRMNCETKWVDSLNAYVHHLKLGKSYRNKLKLVGVDYDVPAYVKVVVTCAGIAQMEQDTSSQACVNEARRVSIQDETRVLANDSLSTYIFPYKEWLTQADSVALHWEGPDSAIVWVEGNNCEFSPDVIHAWDYYEIPPHGEYHLRRGKMENALNSGTQDTAGFFFAKIFSPEEGYFSTRPLVPETKGATLLQYDSIQRVSVADHPFYCFPNSWESVEWVANTRRVVKMYLHTSPELAPVDSFTFEKQDSMLRVLRWNKQEMALVNAHAEGSLLFVRFACSGNFKFTPYMFYSAGPCASSSIKMRSGLTLNSGSDKIYRLKYDEWENYSMRIKCVCPGKLQYLFIMDTCQVKSLRYDSNATKKRTLYYWETSRGGGELTLDSDTIATWSNRVTPDGYLYVRTSVATGTITFTSDRPEEQDPDDGLPLDPPVEEEPGDNPGDNPGDDPGDNPGGDTPTDLSESLQKAVCAKVLYNGQLVIVRAGKYYSVTGQELHIEL